MKPPKYLFSLEVETITRHDKTEYKGYSLPSGGFVVTERKVKDLRLKPDLSKTFSAN